LRKESEAGRGNRGGKREERHRRGGSRREHRLSVKSRGEDGEMRRYIQKTTRRMKIAELLSRIKAPDRKGKNHTSRTGRGELGRNKP